MHRPTLLDFLMLIALAAIWGSSFLIIKLALVSVPPATIAAARIVIAAVVLWALAAARGHRLAGDRRTVTILFLMGTIGTMLPFTLINWGEQRIDSGLTAILMSVVPLATLGLAHFTTADEPFTLRKLIGVICGFIGLVILVGGVSGADLMADLLAEAAIIVAALCYALIAILARKLAEVPVEVVTAGTMVTASLVVVLASLIFDRPWALSPSLSSMLAILTLGLVSTALSGLVLFGLVKRAGVTFVSLNNYLVPVIGMALGALLLGETVAPERLAGLGFILGGIALTAFDARHRQITR